MKRFLALAISAIMMFSLCGCDKKKDEKEEKSSDAAVAEQQEFDQWLWDSFEESVTSDTITLHYTLAHPEDFGVNAPEVTYGDADLSEEALAEDKTETEDTLKEMDAFDYDLLTEDQQFTYDILYDYVETSLEFYDYVYLYEPFAYTSGLHANLPITLSEYTFYDKEDVEDYLKLLELAPDYFQVYLDFEEIKSEKGLFMNDNCADEVIRQCEEFIADPEKNLLIETFNDHIGEVEGLSEQEIEDFKEANYNAVMDYIIPTYENVIEVFEGLKGTGENDLGLCHLENGKEYYAYLIKDKVGTDRTPEEIIALLDEQISIIMNEYTSAAMGNMDAYLMYYEDYTSFYQDTDPKETIEYFEECFDEKFPEIPDIDFTVTPIHESLENSVSPAFYMTPPMDDYENNSIYINEGSDASNALWSTYAHEGVPGHMYQFVYFLANDPEPIRTVLNFNGYAEGWATYVENMAFEYYDGYSDPIYATFEEINGKLNLLVSARIEIGVNYEGWTLEDTEDYLTENGFNAEVAAEIMDYVIAEPANYQMYCTGWLEFEELRAKAEDELGDKFDEVEFHRVLLDAGPCQFYLLEEKVDAYIKENK